MNTRRLARVFWLLPLFLFPGHLVWAQTGGVVIDPVLPDEELTIPEPADAGMFPIPPVIDRPIGEDEGDRLFVSSFELKGVIDRSEMGIDQGELSAILEQARMEAQGLSEVGEDGFTDAERMEIASFMRAVVNDPDWDNKLSDYEALVDKLREEKVQREAGMTIGQIQNVANTVTEFYRRAGFVLAQAYIPAQEVADGVVAIEVIEGTLGSVLAEGNKRFSDKLLAAMRQQFGGHAVKKA